jgi:hypothetical protein
MADLVLWMGSDGAFRAAALTSVRDRQALDLLRCNFRSPMMRFENC